MLNKNFSVFAIYVVIFFIESSHALQTSKQLKNKFEYVALGKFDQRFTWINGFQKSNNHQLWIVGDRGVLAHNGYDFTHMANANSESGFVSSDKMLNLAAEDAIGNRWFATSTDFYHIDKEKFTPIVINRSLVNTERIKDIHADKKGFVWVLFEKHLAKFSTNTKQFVAYFPLNNTEDHFFGKNSYFIKINTNHLSRNNNNYFWLISSSGQLFRFNKLTSEIIVIKSINEKLPNNYAVYDSDFLDNNNLLLATSEGLYRYNILDKVLYLFPESHPITDPASALSISNTKEVWVAIQKQPSLLGTHLVHINSNLETTYYDQKDFDNTNPLYFNTVFVDEQNTTYVMSVKGFYRATPSYTQVRQFKDIIKEDEFIEHLTKDHQQNLWLGYKNGLIKSRRVSNQLHYQTLQQPNGMPFHNVSYLFTGFNNSVWVAHQHGITQFDKNGHQHFYPFIHPTKATASYINMSMIQNHRGTILISIQGQGIFKLDPKTGIYTTMKHLVNNNDYENITGYGKYAFLATSPDHRQFLSADLMGYASIFDLENENVLQQFDGMDKMYLKNQEQARRTSIMQVVPTDTQGITWLIHHEPYVSYYDWNSKKSSTVKLPTERRVLNVNLDLKRKDHYWINTGRSGAHLWSSSDNQLRSFGLLDGIPNAGVGSYSPAIPFPDGSAIYGSRRRLIVIEPNDGKVAARKNHALINRISINGIQVLKDKTLFDLSHKQNNLLIEFYSENSVQPKRVVYQYRLLGFDQKWKQVNWKNRQAAYTHLSPGNFQFQLRASSLDGVFRTKTAEFSVIIHPPFWKTWTAYLAYCLLLITFIFCLIRKRTILLEKRSQELTNLVDHRTKELKYQKELYSQLLDDVSHEFKTPLAVIKGRAILLKPEIHNEQSKAAIDVILKLSTQLAVVVEDAITMGCTQYISDHNSKHLVSISAITQEVCHYMACYATDKDQTFLYTIEKDIFQYCDSKSIEKLFTNLVSNAIKYTPNGGSINIDIRKKTESFYNIQVEDNGYGIAQQYHDKVYQRFSRFTNDNHSQISGSGIGLSLVKEIVDTYKGTIKFSSQVNKGTKFIVTMPLAALPLEIMSLDSMPLDTMPPDTMHLETTSLETKPLKTMHLESRPLGTHANTDKILSQKSYSSLWKNIFVRSTNKQNQAIDVQETSIDRDHIADMMVSTNNENLPQKTSIDYKNNHKNENCPHLLVIEDNLELRQLLVDQLTEHFHISTAVNGQTGLDVAIQQLPMLIISDINMPIMDGYELTEKIKQHEATSHIPIILLTAKADMASKIKGYQSLADGYIPKPYDSNELIAIIQSQLNNRQQITNTLKKAFKDNIPSLPDTLEKNLDDTSSKVINACMIYIKEHYHRNNLNVADIANVACLSERQLLRKFQAVVGMSPKDFINDYRLSVARVLIRQKVSVKKASLDVGFESPTYFSRQYKKKFGLPPSQDTASEHNF